MSLYMRSVENSSYQTRNMKTMLIFSHVLDIALILKSLGKRQVISRDSQDKDGVQAAEQVRDQQGERGSGAKNC